jgi:hypothetical protein
LPLVYHPRGFLAFVVPTFGQDGVRQYRCARLCELSDRLGCVIYHTDGGEDWTEYVRQGSGRST